MNALIDKVRADGGGSQELLEKLKQQIVIVDPLDNSQKSCIMQMMEVLEFDAEQRMHFGNNSATSGSLSKQNLEMLIKSILLLIQQD